MSLRNIGEEAGNLPETSFAVELYFGAAKISVTTTFSRWHRFPKIWPKISGADLTERSSLNETTHSGEHKRTQRDNVQQSRSLVNSRETLGTIQR